MVDAMKRVLFVMCLCAATLAAGDPAKVKAVYLLSMGSGLDQYLANRLTEARLFQVVADPKKADAVLTDQLGPVFEARLTSLRAEPAQPAKPAEGAAKPAAKGDISAADPAASTGAEPPPAGTWARGRGNVFLVDSTTREVLWSIWLKGLGPEPKQLDRTASAIVRSLKEALKSPEAKKKK
jgi:hypothetical protein